MGPDWGGHVQRSSDMRHHDAGDWAEEGEWGPQGLGPAQCGDYVACACMRSEEATRPNVCRRGARPGEQRGNGVVTMAAAAAMAVLGDVGACMIRPDPGKSVGKRCVTITKSCCRELHMLQLVQHHRIPMAEALQLVGSACLPYTALCLPAPVHTAGHPAPGQLCTHEHARPRRGQLDVARGRRFGVGPCQEGGSGPAGTGAQDQPLASGCHSLSSR